MYCLPIDLETSLHNKGDTAVGSFEASPFHPDNWIVWAGWVVLDDQMRQIGKTHVKRYQKGEVAIPAPDLSKGQCIVAGHNIGFDVLHLCNPNNKHWRDWVDWLFHPDAKLWDTQVVEYRLRGQTMTMPSMDDSCERRGWPVKPGRMKEYWKAGISTEDIDDEEVRPYQEHDAETTSRLFKDQVREVAERGMMAIVRVENDSILATAQIRYNGMWFDREGALREYYDELLPRKDRLASELTALLMGVTGLPYSEVNPNSNPLLNKVLYGGEVSWDVKAAVLVPNPENPWECIEKRYKSGKKKGQVVMGKERQVRVLERMVTSEEYTGVGEETLLQIKADQAYRPEIAEVFDKVLELRKLTKAAETYFLGYGKLTWPQDSCIHADVNHTTTVTTRLSSSNPNLQNPPKKGDVRRRFKSRYKDGVLVEYDLSQIEVVVQAFLSQDPQMIADIEAGVDFHCKRAAAVAGVPYEFVLTQVAAAVKEWVDRRQDAKEFSFQRAYGAGAPKISVTTGMSRSVVEALIEAEENMYSGVVSMQNKWLAEVKRNTKERDGIVCGMLKDVTGTEFRFVRELDFHNRLSIKPTTVKNYPIQGLAATIIKIILGLLRRYIWELNRELCKDGNPLLMVGTVHDSVIFDVPPWVHIPTFDEQLRYIFTVQSRKVFQARFGVEFNVPIRADGKVGPNWREMENIS